MIRVQQLHFPPTGKYARGGAPDLPSLLFLHLRTTAPEAGIEVAATKSYLPGYDWLMLYGAGGVDRQPAITAQLAAGGRVVAWDAPYWARGSKLRVSIDGLHPTGWVMRRTWPADRLRADGVAVADVWDPAGPILLAGVGRKSRIHFGGATIDAWETATLHDCRTRWPGRPIWWRPKPNSEGPPPPWAKRAVTAHLSIDAALRGVGLVVTYHSNVAVDAIRMGIPVVCRTGAAAAVCPATLGPADPAPLDRALRTAFLANLAWFQWAPMEARAFWAFATTLLGRPGAVPYGQWAADGRLHAASPDGPGGDG